MRTTDGRYICNEDDDLEVIDLEEIEEMITLQLADDEVCDVVSMFEALTLRVDRVQGE